MTQLSDWEHEAEELRTRINVLIEERNEVLAKIARTKTEFGPGDRVHIPLRKEEVYEIDHITSSGASEPVYKLPTNEPVYWGGKLKRNGKPGQVREMWQVAFGDKTIRRAQ